MVGGPPSVPVPASGSAGRPTVVSVTTEASARGATGAVTSAAEEHVGWWFLQLPKQLSGSGLDQAVGFFSYRSKCDHACRGSTANDDVF